MKFTYICVFYPKYKNHRDIFSTDFPNFILRRFLKIVLVDPTGSRIIISAKIPHVPILLKRHKNTFTGLIFIY